MTEGNARHLERVNSAGPSQPASLMPMCLGGTRKGNVARVLIQIFVRGKLDVVVASLLGPSERHLGSPEQRLRLF